MSSIIRQTDRQTSGNFHPLPLINLWQKPFAKKAVVMPKTKFVCLTSYKYTEEEEGQLPLPTPRILTGRAAGLHAPGKG